MKAELFTFPFAQTMFSLVGAIASFGGNLLAISKNETPSRLVVFPRTVMRGILGELARELAKGTEVPEEFVYAAALTCLGSIVSGQLQINLGLDSDTRLYTVLLGNSYEVRKSTAMRKTLDFFQSLKCPWNWHVSHGVASAEGLVEILTPAQVAERLHVKPSWVYEQTRERADVRNSDPLPFIKMGRYLRFDWPDVAAWLDRQKRGNRDSATAGRDASVESALEFASRN